MEIVDKRQVILQAAAKRFSNAGFHETKVEQIAEDAGVAKGTVYLYFKDKLNLLFEVSRYFVANYYQEVVQAVEPCVSARDKLRAYAGYHISRFPEIMKFHKLNVEHFLKVHQDEATIRTMRDDQKMILNLLTGVIEHGIARKEFRDVKPTDAALLIWGSMHAYANIAIMSPVEEKRDYDQQADSFIDLVIEGLARHE